MTKVKSIATEAPEPPARALGLGELEAQEWVIQHVLLEKLRHAVQADGLTHTEVARRGGSSTTCRALANPAP